MKTNSTKNWMKVAGLSLAIGTLAFTANAQNASPTGQAAVLNSDATAAGKTGGSIRLIDNKGTIKYLQVENGLTAITNIAKGTPTTTWQLGGTLTANATLVASDTKEFQLNGLKLVDYSTVATAAGTVGGRTNGTLGWTVLVRDEATGSIEKVVLKDLLQVQGGQTYKISDGTKTVYSTTDIPGLPTTTDALTKISVYRNGAKLIAGVDYKYDNTNGITLQPNAGGGTAGTDPDYNGDWALYSGDIIEVQWVK
jgi:hypothetical protein